MRKKILIGIVALFMVDSLFGTENSEQKPFSCEASGTVVSYVTEGNAQDGKSNLALVSIKDGTILSNSQFQSPTEGVNSIGYNVKDDYIWGYNIPKRQIVRIGSDNSINYYDMDNAPDIDGHYYNAADVSSEGILYMKSDKVKNRLDRVELDGSKNVQHVLTSISLDQELYADDFAFNPKDGKIYFIDYNDGYFKRIDITGTNGSIKRVKEVGEAYVIIATFDVDGNFYYNAGKDENDNKIINKLSIPYDGDKMKVEDIVKIENFSKINGVTQGDGARCANAPVKDSNDELVPFSCDDTLYFSNQTPLGTDSESKESNSMYLHSIDRSQNPYSFIQIGEKYNHTYNTLAYNPVDNFLYATFGDHLLKIDKNGVVLDLGKIEGFKETQTDKQPRQHYSGVIDRDGIFYIGNWEGNHTDEIFKIDISNRKLIGIIHTTLNNNKFNLNYVDMAIDKDNQYLYLVHGKNDASQDRPNQLVKVEISTGKITFIGDAKDNESLVDTIYMDNSQRLFVLFHEGGFVELDPQTGERSFISDAPITAGLNDGAICPNATLDIKSFEKPFTCNSNSYLFSSDRDATYAKAEIINLIDGNITTAKERFGTYHINGIGFNPVDGFIYGWQSDEGAEDNDYIRPNAHLVKVDADYNVYPVNLKEELSDSQKRFFLGDVSKDGIYYMADMEGDDNSYSLSKIRVIDLNSKTPKDDITINYPDNATRIVNADFAINPIDDNLYMVNANNNQLIRITLNGSDAGEYEELGEVYPLGTDRNTYSVFDFFDKFGNFYFQIGSKIYKIDISHPWSGKDDNKAVARPFSNIDLDTSGDGARCALAPVGDKPMITVANTSIVEGDDGQKNMVFEVKILNDENPSSLTVNYQVLDGNYSNEKLNATASEDYISSGVLETRVLELASDFNISIPIKGDKKVEADEKLLLKLSVVSGNYITENLGELVAVGTIIDDDRPKGRCFATTDNHNILFLYDDLDESDGLGNPITKDTTEMLNGEGGAYRAKDGYLYQFTQVGNETTYTLKRVDLNDGNVTTVKTGFNINHIDAAEFYYDPQTKNERFYVVDKHGSDEEGSIFYEIDPDDDWKILSAKYVVNSDLVKMKLGSLAIDPYSGEMYGTLDYGGFSGDEGKNPTLYSLEIKSDKVVVTKIFDLPEVDAEGLAFSNDGKLYLETEEADSEDAEHKIYRVDIYNKKIIAVSNSGTAGKDPLDKNENDYVDIETLSCNGGDYQAPPRFSIDQKEIDITEGNPDDGSKSKLNPEEISFVVRANRAIREDDGDVMFAAQIQENGSTATLDEDYKQFEESPFYMRVGESELNISKALVVSDLVVENDEYFNIALISSIGSFVDEDNIVKVNIIDDDFTTFTAYDTDDENMNVRERKIKTKIAGELFVLTLDNIDNPNGVEDVNRSTTKVKIVDHLDCDKSLDELNVSSYSLFSIPEGEFDYDVGFTIYQAMKDARVMFIWSDRKGNVRTSCSTDHFAIRPKSFSFGDVGPSSLKKAVAGKPYNLKINAKTGENRVVGYNETNNESFKIDANQTQIDKCSFDDSDFDDSNMTQFANGLLDGTIKYGNVGKLSISISEIEGSEFAKVDENDTAWSDRQIDSNSTTIEFVPDHFKIDVAFENSHTNDGYAFYSNDVDSSPKWTITALAVDENDNILKNYNSECLGGKSVDLNISLDVNASDSLTIISNIDSEKDVRPNSKVTLDSNISDFEEGQGSTEVHINFKRGIMPLDPSKVTMDKVSVKDGLTTGLSIKPDDSSVQYQYMRAYIQDPISVIGTKEITTEVYYETYESSSCVVNAKKGGRSKSGENSWFKVLNYDNRSGKMSYSVGTSSAKYSASYASSSTRISVTNEDNKTVRVTASNLPEKNVVSLSVKDEFSPSTTAKISTHVSFMPDTVNWAGKGDVGMIVDTNVSKRSIFKKMNW
jgi:hypothetical protein